jgi:TusA-related sulfurtransferase
MNTKNEITLDVSELEAPYPLIELNKAIDTLQTNEILIFKHRMFPCKLPDVCKENDLVFEVIKEEENEFVARIER